jgi:hypothetical protein
VAFSPQANYTDWATATCPQNLVPTFADRGVSRGQRGGPPTVVNLSFLDRTRYFSVRQLLIYPHEAKWAPFQTNCYSVNLVEVVTKSKSANFNNVYRGLTVTGVCKLKCSRSCAGRE